jgi:drug/metabolite transporter (DMT)-like permease
LWLVSLLAHLIGNTGYNITLRHAAAAKGIDSAFLAAVMSAAIGVPALIGMIVCGVDFSHYGGAAWIGFFGYAASVLVFHIVNAKALEYAEASVFTFLYNLRIGIATILSIVFLGEAVEPVRLTGGALVFVAGFILMGKVGAERKGILLSVASAAVISVANLLEKMMITAVGYTDFIFPSSVLIAVALWLPLLIRKKQIAAAAFKSPSVVGLMVLRGISAYGFTLALAFGGLLSVSIYISSFSVVTTSLAGILILKERDAIGRKAAAAAVALIGVTLIFVGSR